MIRIRKGLNIPITGLPDQCISEKEHLTSRVALLGDDYIGLKPTMAVTENMHVQAGQVLCTDKKEPHIKYTAPASGTVTHIHRGHKRKLEAIVIERDHTPGLSFQKWSADQLESLSRSQIVDHLIETGLWCALRTRPYGKIPAPQTIPHSLFVTAIDTRPLSINPEVVLQHYRDDFINGLTILKKLTPGKTFLCTAPETQKLCSFVEHAVFTGPHPAGLVGTHIHYLDPVSTKKIVWHIDYQEVIAIGKLFCTGQLWLERMISLCGPSVKKPRLLSTCLGACTTELIKNELHKGDHRIISGSVLDGRSAKTPNDFLGRYHYQVSVIEEGYQRSFLHYLRIGLDRFSVLPIYLSKLLTNKRFAMTTTTHGSARAIVPVGSYEKVMPLDILPTQLLRYLIVGDIEMAEKLGMLELIEEDVALCTFVCPAKYEFGPILRDNLTLFEKEA